MTNYYPKPGEYITVVSWLNRFENSYKGECMEVIAIQDPYIQVRSCIQAKSYPRTLDLREVSIMKLNNDYVLAACAFTG